MRRGPEGVLRHRTADGAIDALGAPGLLVRAPRVAGPVLLSAVGIAHRHANHHDRVDDRGGRRHPRDAPAGPHDDGTTYALAQNPIGAADIAGRLGRDGGGFEAEARLAHGHGSVTHDIVCGRPPVGERQVEMDELQVESEDSGIEHPQGLLEQLLSRLVPVADNDLVAR